MLAGGNDSFTGIASGGTTPYKYNWTFGDGTPAANGGNVTHIFGQGGSYTVTLNITDATSTRIRVSRIVQVQGSPINLDGWLVNWAITDFHGVEISNVTYNGVLTIRDALYTGVLVKYSQQPRGQLQCIFFDDLGRDELATAIAGLSLQISADPSNPWFQIRANFNPSGVGYNYTTNWRFYQNGRWDAEMVIGHLGCAWNHVYTPFLRVDLDIGNANRDIMRQYTPSGAWQNLVWEGNYTDNGFRDLGHNSTQWGLGDGRQFYYMSPTVIPWQADFPTIPSKIYLVRERPGEIGMTTNPSDPRVDPIVYANGELAYRQNLALWFLPSVWDRWIGQGSPIYAPASLTVLSFYPNKL